MQLFRSTSCSAALNCAFEEYILTERSLGDVLLFYINRPAVIVGRNQSVEAEVDLNYCREQGIEVVRRFSGGGTVYHDMGNINYAFVADKQSGLALDRDFTAPIVDALHALGIDATVGRRRELLVGGRKISGTASHIGRNRQLFHGTLLHRTDLEALDRALQGDSASRAGRVASVPSPVVNLSQELAHTPWANESTEEFLQRVLQFFETYYLTTSVVVDPSGIEEVRAVPLCGENISTPE